MLTATNCILLFRCSQCTFSHLGYYLNGAAFYKINACYYTILIQGHNRNDNNTLHYFGYCSENDAERCRQRNREYFNGYGTWPEHYYRNTGVVNLHLIPGVLSEQSAVHIFVHELGHSLGARHDDEEEDCISNNEELFLMTSDAKVSCRDMLPLMKVDLIMRFFSLSENSIRTNVQRVVDVFQPADRFEFRPKQLLGAQDGEEQEMQ